MRIVEVRKVPFSGKERKPRVYFWPKGETILENFGNRRDRPINEYRKLLPEVMRIAGLGEKMRCNWSQKAGCSCGCSPGFIMDARMYGGGDDLHVDIEGGPWVKYQGGREEREEERAQLAYEQEGL